MESAEADAAEEIFSDAVDIATSKATLAKIFALEFGIERVVIGLSHSTREKGKVTVTPIAEVL